MNIPMNFNMSQSIRNNIGKNAMTISGSNNSNSFEKIISNINEKSSLLNDDSSNDKDAKNSYSQDELKNSISSFEDLLTNLINEDENEKLNEEFSFLQNIMQSLVFNNENLQVENNDNINLDINTDVDISNNNNSNNGFDIEILNILNLKKDNYVDFKNLNIENIINTRNFDSEDIPKALSFINTDKTLKNKIESNIDIDTKNIQNDLNTNIKLEDTDLNMPRVILNEINVDKPFRENTLISAQDNTVSIVKNEAKSEDYLIENISKDANLILEFMDTLDEKSILSIENLDNNNLKKDALTNSFREFLVQNYNYSSNDSSVIKSRDNGIDTFYNTFKTSSKIDDIKTDKSIDLLDSNELIDLLSNRSITQNNTDTFSESVKSNSFTLHQDNIAQDLQSGVLYMKNSNLRQLKFKLTPRELGEMVIDISQVDNTSNITLTVSNEETLNLIQTNLKEIISSLKEMNLISDASSVVVQSDSNQKEFLSNSNSFSNQHNKHNNESKVNFDIDSIENLDNNIDTKIKSNSKLNILA